MTKIHLMDLLKKKSRLHHIEIMHQPYFQDLLKCRLKIEMYYIELFNLKEIYTLLSVAIEKKLIQDIKVTLSDYNEKVDKLKKDISFIEKQFQLKLNKNFSATQIISELIKASNELEILGIVYVFEGSSLGSSILSERLKLTHNFIDSGIEFLSNHNSDVRIKWLEFGFEMNKRIIEEKEKEIVMKSALRIFNLLNALYKEIYLYQT